MAKTSTFLRKTICTALSCLAVGAVLASASTAQAADYWGGSSGHYRSNYHGGFGGGYYGGYGGGQYGATRGSHCHAPSVHYDRTYHQDSLHWTPRRGLHSHGHYDYTPHYTPGHFHH